MGQKKSVNTGRAAKEANTGTTKEGKLMKEEMANEEGFLEMSLRGVSKRETERNEPPRKINYTCKGKHGT